MADVTLDVMFCMFCTARQSIRALGRGLLHPFVLPFFLGFLFVYFFEVRFYNVDQTGLKLTEIHLSSAWNAGIKGVFHHAQHTVH